MTRKIFASLAAVVTTLLFAGSAEASGVWVSISPTDSPFTISAKSGNTTANYSITYSPTPANGIYYYDGNLSGGQSVTNVQNWIANEFNIASSSLTEATACAVLNGASFTCDNGSTMTGAASKSGTLNSTNAFEYLAVHFGGGDLLFHWLSPIKTFSISGLPNGLSNVYAFTDPVSAVPLPAAAWLFGSALLGFTMVSSRKKV